MQVGAVADSSRHNYHQLETYRAGIVGGGPTFGIRQVLARRAESLLPDNAHCRMLSKALHGGDAGGQVLNEIRGHLALLLGSTRADF